MLDKTNSRPKKYLLIGPPNSGKTSLFNRLTGEHAKVANYSGITVSSGKGHLLSNKASKEKVELLDLPGIYSLSPEGPDEGVTVATLMGLFPGSDFNKIILVLDSQRLESSLSLALSLRELGIRQVVCLLNKCDHNEWSESDRDSLENFLKFPVLPISIKSLDIAKVDNFIREKGVNESSILLEEKILILKEGLKFLPPVLVKDAPYKLVNGNTDQGEHLITERGFLEKERKRLDEVKAFLTFKCYGESKTNSLTRSSKIDRYLLHPFVGSIVFLVIFYFVFNSLYSWASPLMDKTESLILYLGEFVGTYLPEGQIKSLVIEGIFAGVGGVVIFLPQIMILFFLLSLLEQSGYIARASIVTDKVMRVFGLGGKSFLPYLSGFACAIPGIMATRTITNSKERIATILTLPLIPCSARLPVYILLVGTFIPNTKIFGVLNSKTISFFFLYFIGLISALIFAKIFRLSIFRGKDEESNIVELPPYQIPNLIYALKSSWKKGKSFLKKVGTVILGLSIVIWALSNYPKVPQGQLSQLEPNQIKARQLERSYLGKTGKALEPILKPIGMNWQMGVGLLVSLGARELFVSAMGTLYALGEVDEENKGLREQIRAETDPTTGRPIFGFGTVWSILLFFVYGLQCTSTLVVIKNETGGWKHVTAAFTYMMVVAYIASYVAYSLLS